ncbi:hypothetical protein N1851_018858 [Merluccius polli]|uniref:Uncharacterized protein n=1 Tax=Merluccius polli TaxID=89951 RepID=A0AA47MN13_MERPO|nr:hypothetical protein N1851_018858 [Merluccius polli]
MKGLSEGNEPKRPSYAEICQRAWANQSLPPADHAASSSGEEPPTMLPPAYPAPASDPALLSR